jgi:hypothetical protein
MRSHGRLFRYIGARALPLSYVVRGVGEQMVVVSKARRASFQTSSGAESPDTMLAHFFRGNPRVIGAIPLRKLTYDSSWISRLRRSRSQ